MIRAQGNSKRAEINWTPDMDAVLTKAWSACSATDIARILPLKHCRDGGRNAVIGRARRLKLPAKCKSSLTVRALLNARRAEFRALWLDTAMTVDRIAETLGVSSGTVFRLARRMNLPLRGSGPPIPEAKRAALLELYRQGVSYNAIQRKLRVSSATIARVVKAEGLETRKKPLTASA